LKVVQAQLLRSQLDQAIVKALEVLAAVLPAPLELEGLELGEAQQSLTEPLEKVIGACLDVLLVFCFEN